MRPPFKTEQELAEHLALLSEISRADYRRRVEQASVAAFAAHLERELAVRAESIASKTQAQVTLINVAAAVLIVMLAAATGALDLPYGRVVTWFVAGAWGIYLGAVQLLLVPQFRFQQLKHWSYYQKHAREWAVLLGSWGFAEHLALVGAEYRGESLDNAEAIELAVRGYALVHAQQSAFR